MATELAKAYVQIIPSAKDFKTNLEAAMGDQSEEAGKTAGNKTGNSLVSTIKKVVVAAGIGKILKDSLSAGADLQQSIGGIETLFKESADTVIANAKKAYETAGVSANDYMEQVTSFSASLLQSVGGDTAEAARLADQAVIDMADNANKMGSSMESIQNAYSGFAKGNYTMLDNLKLGYGGTKEEMKRLLTDAEKLSGVKYDMSNLNDVYEAIHVIQTDLDITGTTAKEASETFTGSFSAMKAAAENVLGALSTGEGLSEALSGLFTSTETFVFDNLLPMVGTIVSQLPEVIGTAITEVVPSLLETGTQILTSISDGITQGLPTLDTTVLDMVNSFIETIAVDAPAFIEAAGNLVSNLVTGFIEYAPTAIEQVGVLLGDIVTWLFENAPTLMQNGVDFILQLVNGITTGMPDIIASLEGVLTNLITTIVTNLPTFLEKGVAIIGQLVSGIGRALPTIVSSIAGMLARLVITIIQNLPTFLQKGIELIGRIISGIISAIPDVIKGIGSVITTIFDEFGKIDWLELGGQIISGIINGLAAGIGSVVEAAKGVAESALGGIKNFLGIKSPSRVMRDQVGKMITEGIAVGITSNTGAIEDAAKTASDTVTNGISGITGTVSVGTMTGKTNGSINTLATAFTNLERNMGDNMKEAVKSLKLEIGGRDFGRIVADYA